MHKTMVYLDDDLWRALRETARTRCLSAASIVREALRESLVPARRPRKLRFVGVADGPADDTGRRADDVLRALLGKKK